MDSFLIYLTTVFVASIIPGPSMILALTHGIKYGAKKKWQPPLATHVPA